MAKKPYDDLSILQLADVYFVTLKNYGRIDGDLLDEINERGGEQLFLRLIEKEKQLNIEKDRIRKEVSDLMTDDQNTSLIKKLIHSDLMTDQELANYIDLVHRAFSNKKSNKQIDGNTIVWSLVGVLIASFVGALIAAAQILSNGKFYFASLVIIYGVSFFVIKFLTKKNADNALVFVSALVATILGPVAAFFFLGVSFHQ